MQRCRPRSRGNAGIPGLPNPSIHLSLLLPVISMQRETMAFGRKAPRGAAHPASRQCSFNPGLTMRNHWIRNRGRDRCREPGSCDPMNRGMEIDSDFKSSFYNIRCAGRLAGVVDHFVRLNRSEAASAGFRFLSIFVLVVNAAKSMEKRSLRLNPIPPAGCH